MLRRAVEPGVDHIDTAQCYGPDVANQLIREALHPYPDDLVLVSKVGAVNLRLTDDRELSADQRVPLEDQLAEMVALREEGKIAGVGISTATRAQVEQAIKQAGIGCVQNAFSLLDRTDTEVLDLCPSAGVAYVPYFPLGSAFPGMPKVTENAAVRAVAQRVGASPAQVGRAWPGSWPTETTCC